MTGEDTQQGNTEHKQDDYSAEIAGEDGMEFLLFLILILLIMSNQSTFSKHFMVLENEVNKITRMVNVFSSTINGFKSAFNA